MFTCARNSKRYYELDCLEIILGTARSADLLVCRVCPRGKAIMATAVYGRGAEIEDDGPVAGSETASQSTLLPTPKPMPEPASLPPDVEPPSASPLDVTCPGRPWASFLAQLIRGHGEDTGFGYGLSLYFVVDQARKEGFGGNASDLSNIFQECGLKVLKSPLLTLVADARLRRFTSPCE